MNRRHVLVAMKEHSLRRILAGTLRTAGHLVVEAFSDAEMTSEIANAPFLFDAVVRDARKDPQAALDGLARLRAADSDVPAFVLVTKATASFAHEARRLGATVLTVPLTAAELRGTIAHSARAFPLAADYGAGADHYASVAAAPHSA